MYKLGDIFYDDNEYCARARFCNENGLIIKEIEPDENGRRFQIQEFVLSKTDMINMEIDKLKIDLEKYKEDVEQVELFSMERTDYEEKKKLCVDIIKRLRELEKELANS